MTSRISRCITVLAAGQEETYLPSFMEYENYSFPEALKVLADAGRRYALPEKEYSQEERQAQDLRTQDPECK